MRTNTFDDYIVAVKLKYEAEKTGIYAGFLMHPSPAELRNLSQLVFKSGLTKTDSDIFRNFFDVTPDGNLNKGIEQFNVEKFRAVKNFLVGKNQKTNHKSVELVAALVDFQPRPFQKYIKTENGSPKRHTSDDELTTNEDKLNNTFINDETPTSGRIEKTSWKKPAVIAALLLLFATLGFSVKTICFPAQNCMVWKADHYEAVRCDDQPLGIINGGSNIARDEATLQHMKKISANKSTRFFINEKPAIWYKKSGAKLEYFTYPGLHPETGQTLKPITRHIIEKYVLKPKN